MKKLLLAIAGGLLIVTGCNKSETPETIPEEITSEAGRRCASYEVLEEQLQKDPSLRQRMDEIEAFTNRYIQSAESNRLVGDVMEIPVVVNVLYNTAAQNISDAQILSQIDVLNADFAGTNSDITKTPSNFTGVLAGDIKIKFLAPTIIRKSTTLASWSTNDAMKKSSQGGIDPTSPATTLNIWVCNMGGGILGYAQFPGGALATDGVVIDDNAMGTTGTAAAPFNKGRTATHEVGHYLNLRHIWGDRRCGDDFIGDTPAHDGANYGCPAAGHISKCAGKPVEMTMNYMDYTDDACMYMFSAGQKNRMQATYAVGGPRASLR